MKRFIISLFFIPLFFAQNAGTLKTISIDTPSLKNNILDYKPTQKIIVYLPPSYNSSSTNYPVIYFLTGYGDVASNFTIGYYQGFKVHTVMDKLISEKKIKETIFVVVDAPSFLLGTFYANSSVSGNWLDYFTNDVVNYVDNNFRTIKNRESRAVTGHSMGGFGAIHAAMNSSDKFSILYSLSPGVFDKNGLQDQGMFSNSGNITTFINKSNEWAKMTKEEAFKAYRSYVQGLHWLTVFTYAYGSTFSPDLNGNPPYIKYPYTLENGTLKLDPEVLKNFENGYGGWEEKVTKFKNNFLSLTDITLDYGIRENFPWIARGCVYLSELFKKQGINHLVAAFDGGHEDQLAIRLERFMIPRVTEKLKYEDALSAIDDETGPELKEFEITQCYPNPFNPSVNIQYQVNKPDNFDISIYNILGQKIVTLEQGYKSTGSYSLNFNATNISSGILFCRMSNSSSSQTQKLLLLK